MEFDIDLISKWRDPRITIPGAVKGKWYQLNPKDVWHPELVFFNQRRSNALANADKFVIMETDGTGTIVRKEWLPAHLAQDFDFHAFPFDSQIITIEVVEYTYDDKEVLLNSDSNLISVEDNSAEIAGTLRAGSISYQTWNSRGRTRTMVICNFVFTRHLTEIGFEVIFPVMTITAFSTLALMISATEMDRRITISSLGKIRAQCIGCIKKVTQRVSCLFPNLSCTSKIRAKNDILWGTKSIRLRPTHEHGVYDRRQ